MHSSVPLGAYADHTTTISPRRSFEKLTIPQSAAPGGWSMHWPLGYEILHYEHDHLQALATR